MTRFQEFSTTSPKRDRDSWKAESCRLLPSSCAATENCFTVAQKSFLDHLISPRKQTTEQDPCSLSKRPPSPSCPVMMTDHLTWAQVGGPGAHCQNTPCSLSSVRLLQSLLTASHLPVQSSLAAVTKQLRLDNLKIKEVYCSEFQRLRCPRSRRQKTGVWEGPSPHRGCLLSARQTSRRGRHANKLQAPLDLVIRTLIPCTHDLITSWRPHLVTPSPQKLGISSFGGKQTPTAQHQ